MGKKNEMEELMKGTGDIDLANLDGGRLDDKRAKEFIRLIFNQSVMNSQVRQVVMSQTRQKIDKLHLGEPITESASENTTYGTLINPDFTQVDLIASKVRSSSNMTWEFMHENLETEGFEDKWMQTIAGKMSEDFERLNILGDSSITSSVTSYDRLYKTYDGWYKQSLGGAQIVDAAGSNVSKELFFMMKRSMPTQYQADPGLRWFMSPNIMTDYVDSISNRQTVSGDRALEEGNVKILGIPAVEVPLIPDDQLVAAGAATPGQVLSGEPQMYKSEVGADKVTIAVDGGGDQAVAIPVGTYTASELAVVLNGLLGDMTVDAVNGRLLWTSNSLGAASTVEVKAVADSAYAELGLVVGTATGAASGGSVREGSFMWLINPKNFIFGLLGKLRMLQFYNNDFDRNEIRFFSENAAGIENLDSVVMATNVRKKDLI